MFTNIALAQGLKQAGNIAGEIAKQSGANTYSTPQELIGTGINAALAMVGLIFLILMIYAGYLWLTSHGEEEPIKKAQKIIVSSIIGFILVVSAYAITVFVGKRFEVGGGGTAGEDNCTKKHKQWACQDVDSCQSLVGNTKDERLDTCNESGNCEKKLCPGGDYNVCCLGQIQPQGPVDALGDPNKPVCCWVCKEKLWGDFYDDPVLSGMMSEAACKAGCTGEDDDECFFDYKEVADQAACDAEIAAVECDSSDASDF